MIPDQGQDLNAVFDVAGEDQVANDDAPGCDFIAVELQLGCRPG